MTLRQLERRPGSQAMPLHIHRVGEHYSVYEVYLGGLSYYGTYTPEGLLEWLDKEVSERPKQTVRPKEETKPLLNIDLKL